MIRNPITLAIDVGHTKYLSYFKYVTAKSGAEKCLLDTIRSSSWPDYLLTGRCSNLQAVRLCEAF